MERLADRIGIVTGASRGIGRAVALALAGEGAAVVVHYRTGREEAEAVAAEITAGGGRAVASQADVTSEAEVRRLVATAVRSFGGLDLLVCCAGETRDQLAALMTLDDWETVVQGHLRGTFLCVREALPHMLAQRRGAIVALSSVAAEVGSRGHCNYAAAKGGINAMIRALAVELAPKNVRVNAVAPGVIVTEMSRRLRELAGEQVLARIPLGRYGAPEEVARAVVFLASDEASYVTGEVLHVSGGLQG
ncbi:MAG: SDR family NAD(P)-dependent oxidoreductase [Thermoanaerobaculia bacterium]